jgi:hypothetical protein
LKLKDELFDEMKGRLNPEQDISQNERTEFERRIKALEK